jgi:hypothetical protein
MVRHCHGHTLMQCALHQHITRNLATSLANLRCIDAFNTQLACRATPIRPHPQRIAIGDVDDLSNERLARIGAGGLQSHQEQSQVPKYHGHNIPLLSGICGRHGGHAGSLGSDDGFWVDYSV